MTPDVLDDWRTQAACRGEDAELFFPNHPVHGDKRGAYKAPRRIRRPCPVKTQCLDLVIGLSDTADTWGMFGGLTPAQRREVRACRSGVCGHGSHRSPR